jgi:aminodeoxyfutalosine deaminase
MHVASLIAALPKVELHSHLVGSASPDTVLGLARRHPDAGVPTSAEALRDMFSFRDFAHFIDVYHAVDALVTTPDDVTDLVVGAARDAAQSNVRWMELTVTAATHLMAGLSGEEVRAAVERGRALASERHGVELGFIIDIPAEKGLPAAEATVEFLTKHRPEGTVAIGVAGLEAGFPRAMYAEHVAAAGALGLPAVIHAGESTGPETVWSALQDLNAIRIGHGTNAHQDSDLVRHLADNAIPLEVCITSNVCTNSVPSLEEHPVVGYLESGVVVTLATDDAGMFETTLNREYELLAQIGSVGGQELIKIARDGVDVSLAPTHVKESIRAGIADVVGAEHD